MVQFKQGGSSSLRRTEDICLNSTLVQFKQAIEITKTDIPLLSLNSTLVQFKLHKGVDSSCSLGMDRLNSTLVQFKRKRNFLYWRSRITFVSIPLWFNSNRSALPPWDCAGAGLCINSTLVQFKQMRKAKLQRDPFVKYQFHFGSIQTKKRYYVPKSNEIVSIPLWINSNPIPGYYIL